MSVDDPHHDSQNEHDDDHELEDLGWEQVEAACDRYVALYREGNAPSVEDFASAQPELKDGIEEMLPTVLLLEMAREQNLSKRKDGRVLGDSDSFESLGDYQIVGELGRGGMGIVYEAYQPSLDRNVALKVLPRTSMSDDQRERLIAEASTVARLHHSNIAPVFTVGEDQGVCFYAMEKLSGVSLDKFVRLESRLQDDGPAGENVQGSTLTIDQAVDIGLQVSDALNYAHQNGVIHRDVKPANLILGDDGRVWLTDFGLSTRLANPSLENSTSVSGTLRYVAPERFDGAADEVTSDVYSLGITLIELVTGRAAFSAHRRSELLEQIRTNQYGTVQSSQGKVSSDLIKILEKAASLDPNARYQTAGELHDDLELLSLGKPVSANRIGPIRKCWRWCVRNRALAVASGLAIAALLAVAIVSTISYLQTQQLLASANEQRANASNASKVAHQAIDEIFLQLHIGTGLTSIDSSEVALLENERSTHLLNQLTRFYERLAANEAGNGATRLDTVEARRRVGQLHLRLGNYEEAILSFKAALSQLEQRIAKSQSEHDPRSVAERARIVNETGLSKRISGDSQGARAEHKKALQMLRDWLAKYSVGAKNDMVEFEIARTQYFSSHRTRPGMGPNSLPPPGATRPDRDTQRPSFRIFGGPPAGRPPRRPRGLGIDQIFGGGFKKNLREAIATVESILPQELDLSQFDVPLSDNRQDQIEVDFQLSQSMPEHLHLLSLCYREYSNDNRSQWQPEDELYHFRAISILKTLVNQYPNEASYQFDLVRVLAELTTTDGLSEADLRSNCESLNEAIAIGQGLTSRYPSVSDFHMEMSHANNKLASSLNGLKRWATPEEVKQMDLEIEKAYRKAWQHQLELTKIDPESSAFKVWAALFALKLAEQPKVSANLDRRNRLVARATALLQQVPDDTLANVAVVPLVDKAKRLSLLSIADPPSVESDE